MKKTFLSFLLFVIAAESVEAACKTEACRRAMAWKSDYAAIVLDEDIPRDGYFAVLGAMKSNGGVVAIEAEQVLLGWLPSSTAPKIRTTPGVRAVLYRSAATISDLVRSEESRSALRFFNRVVTGEYEDDVEAGLARHGQPLNGCARWWRGQEAFAQAVSATPDAEETPCSTSAKSRSLAIGDKSKGFEISRVVQPNFWYEEPWQNPDMRGRVAVHLFRLDSDGTVDQNEFTWTWDDFVYARDQVYGAFTFWANEAAIRNIQLSFSIFVMDPFSHYTRSTVPTRTKYEPIRHDSWTDDYLWMNDALSAHGYGTVLGPDPLTNQRNVYTQNDAFNLARRSDPSYGPFDRSFTIYVVYNPPPAPSRFLNNRSGYGLVDGPAVLVMWNTDDWFPQNLGRVVTHEVGHIFWACDEYPEQCDRCDYCFRSFGIPRGPRTWTSNRNCKNPIAGSCGVIKVDCVMDNLSVHALCADTPSQIGW